MKKKLFRREKYLSRIRGFYHTTDLIKVITGVRRCGKSSLMHTIAEELIESGVRNDHIFYYNLDKYGYKNIKSEEALEKLLFSNSNIEGTKYVFIDEIQNVKNFELVINALREEDEYSIFITGSNSYLLSGELVTKLTGRYIEFELFTLSFDEYIEMKSFYNISIDERLEVELDKYILEGGFPKTLDFETISDKRTYVESVIEEIFEKDIKRRVQIKNKSVFAKVMRYIINNFGNKTSISNIISELEKDGINIKRETVNRYINILLDAKILYKCERFDLKSKRSLCGKEKYYLADLSFYFINNVDNRINYGPVLENIVYIYAKSYNYKIAIGIIGKFECDFILRGNDMSYSYVQVTMTIMDSIDTENREYHPYEMIRDNFPKYLLTRNDLIQKRNGVIHANIPQFIVEKRKFDL